MSSAVAVQTNGFGSSLWAARYSSILAIRSGTEWNTPRRRALSVSSRNQRSFEKAGGRLVSVNEAGVVGIDAPPPLLRAVTDHRKTGANLDELAANLFLHYAFDAWMSREQPGVKFARYVDDIVVHVETRKHAQDLLAKIGRRMAEVGLSLHPSKTRMVYCQDHRRRAHHEHRSFTFLGYTFAPAWSGWPTAGSSYPSCPASAGLP